MCIYFIYFFFRDVLMLATLIRHDAETLLHSCFGDGGMSRSLIGSRAPNVGGAYS